MLDFTSALYLGFEHPSWSLPGWERLTLGKPAALEELAGASRVKGELAALAGCERVALGASTLHLFCDLFALLAGPNVAIWIDEAAYPIARLGTDCAAALGVPVRVFGRHDAAAVSRAINVADTVRPVIVTDGYCPVRGRHAPLREYAGCAAAAGGLLIVDDTQALGVYGQRAGARRVYGRGGGGSLRYFDLSDPCIVVVSSLAKAFGVPMAMLGGSRKLVDWFRETSATLVHCSPPSAATIAAADQALRLNRQCGDGLRRRLAERVIRFRDAVPDLLATGSLFPVQSLALPSGVDVRALYQELLRRGVLPVLHGGGSTGAPRISFVLTANHRLTEIDYATRTLADALARVTHQKQKRSERRCGPH